MPQIINAHFDGKVIVPDQPVNFGPGQLLMLKVETVESVAKFADLLQFATDLPNAPADLSQNHDHYLYGTPKVV